MSLSVPDIYDLIKTPLFLSATSSSFKNEQF